MSTHFEIGELVHVRDQNDWRAGFVTQLHPLKVQCEGWPALEFSHVRKMASRSPLSKIPLFNQRRRKITLPKQRKQKISLKESLFSCQIICCLRMNHQFSTTNLHNSIILNR